MKATITSVAKEAGVSPMTVSRVINHVPGVSAEKRLRVLEELERQGYRKSPFLAAWQVNVRGDRLRERPNIVFLSGFDEASVQSMPIVRLLESAEARADELSLSMEFFYVKPSQMSWSRVGHIFTARGVSGVIVGPFPKDTDRIELPLEPFAVVACGEDQAIPMVHRVSQDYYSDMHRLFQYFESKGFRYPGLIMERADFLSQDQWMGAFLERQSWLEPRNRVPVHILSETKAQPALRKWFRANKPDVVMLLPGESMNEASKLIEELGVGPVFSIGGILGSDPEYSGLLYPAEEMGRVAVELLAEQLRHYVRGRPSVPKSVRLEGLLKL
jgi:DNA-binding LacI/PurR family transcriptional regulator